MSFPSRRAALWAVAAVVLALGAVVVLLLRPGGRGPDPGIASPAPDALPAPTASLVLDGARPTGTPILLIGLDGADWERIQDLWSAGELPNLKALVDRGAWGSLRSEEPMLSPILWTTIATGQGPLKHRVLDFVEEDPQTGDVVPVTVRQRRAPALWDLFSAAGLESTMIGWWASWPAYPLTGSIVSDRVGFSSHRHDEAEGSGGEGLYYPESLAGKLHSLQVETGQVGLEELGDLTDVNEEVLRHADAALAAGESPYESQLNHLREIVAGALTYHRMALALLEGGQPAFFTVYYEAIDEVCHLFAHCRDPALPACPALLARHFGGTVDAFYRLQDRWLGELLAQVDPATVTVVLSDHGFHTGPSRPRHLDPRRGGGGGARWHRMNGILIMAGPPIRPGQLPLHNLRDVAPTVSYLAGLPVAESLDGRPILRAVRPEFLAEHPLIPIPDYGPWSAADRVQQPAAGGEAASDALKKLAALGYLAPTSGGSAGSGPMLPQVRRLTNEASLLAREGRWAEARRVFRRALDLDHEFLPALLGLARLYQEEGKTEEALRLYEKALPDAWEEDPRTYISAADAYIEAGRVADGLAGFEPVAAEHPETVELQVGLAHLLEAAGRGDEAERTLQRVLEWEPTSLPAAQALFQLLRGQGRLDRLVPYLDAALRERPGSASHLRLRGRVAEEQRRLNQAAIYFMRASEAAPEQFEPLLDMGRVMAQQGRWQEAISLARIAVEQFPRVPMAAEQLGRFLLAQGDKDGARQAFEEAERLGLRNAEVFRMMGDLAAGDGRTEVAQEYYGRSLDVEPDQPELRQQLEALGGS